MIKKVLSRFILISLLGTLLFLGVRTIGDSRKMAADSGFDYSYDGGGSSWSGGSDFGSSWSSSHDYSWDGSSSFSGSSSGTYIDLLIYVGFLFLGFVVSMIRTISNVKNPAMVNVNRAKSFYEKLYDTFHYAFHSIYNEKYDDLKLLVTDKLYEKIINEDNEIKENIVTHDDTRVISEDDNSVVLEFILKVASYKNIDGKIQRVDGKELEKNKYRVEFIRNNSDTDWLINNVSKTFMQKVVYEGPTFNTPGRNYEQIDISKYVPDKEKFLNDRYNDYVAIQEAWMNFDYDVLKDKLTNELYNQYEMQLETLKAKHEKNVMKNFINNGIVINNVVEENGLVTVNLILHVSQIDYIEKDGSCVRGNSGKVNHVDYNLTFISNLDIKDKKCPNCGNPLEDISSQTCKYCHSTITLTPNKWVMSKKQIR